MKRSLKRVLVTVGATAALAVSLPVSSAAAINTAPCSDRTDFVKIEFDNGAPPVCYANAGGAYVSHPGVYRISSGNNRLVFASTMGSFGMEKWQSRRMVESPTITQLWIL